MTTLYLFTECVHNYLLLWWPVGIFSLLLSITSCACRYRGCVGIFDEPNLKLEVPVSSSTASNPSSLELEIEVSEDSSSHQSRVAHASEGTSSLTQDTPAVQRVSSKGALSLEKVESSSSPHCFFQLTCGPDLCVSGTCSSRKEAKELGAQALLQVGIEY